MTSDTPRTCPHCGAFLLTHHTPAYCEERAARKKAEAERDQTRKDLIKNLQTTGGIPWREWSAECAKETRRANENLERAEKAEADVKRLNKQLNHIVENPHEYDVKSVFEPPFVEELQSEIKMLTKKLRITEDELADAREWLNERYKAISEADERAEKAEADVERLRTALQSCYWATNTYDGNYTRALDNVATIAINALKTQDK
jgi:chromosome segregation ATPase